jgi:hypothetical protein
MYMCVYVCMCVCVYIYMELHGDDKRVIVNVFVCVCNRTYTQQCVQECKQNVRPVVFEWF